MAQSVAEQLWSFLTGHGLTPTAAAGVIGNLQQESSLNPHAPGGGLAQWIGARWTGLEQYAGGIGQPANSLTTQEGYLWLELSSGYYGNLGTLNAEPTPGAAAQYFEQNYEKAGAPMMPNRISYANDAYAAYGPGGTGVYTPTITNTAALIGATDAAHTASNGAADFLQQLKNGMQFHGWQFWKDGETLGIWIFFIVLALALIIIGLVKSVGAQNVAKVAGAVM